MIRFTFYALLCFSLVMGLYPYCHPSKVVSAQTTDLFTALEACRFNAYTTRDDLIIGAVIYNWETGAGCTQNLNTVFPIASVGKLFVLDVLYQRISQGLATFDDQITFTPNYWMNDDDGCLQASQLNQPLTLGYLGNMMIQCSDNVATWILMDYLGWDTVNNYVRSLGIPDLGEVIPYSRVDQLKLMALDPRWEAVPTHLASQFYRSRRPEGLVPTYFDRMPRYSREEFKQANATYLSTYSYNVASPYAMALYMERLRQQLLGSDATASSVARWLFNTMLLTQRMFSTQYLPGDVYVGSKNGFDTGYRAEVNITVRDLNQVLPETLDLVFVRHRDVTIEELNPFRFQNVPTTDLLLAIGPKVADLLYPQASTAAPALVSDSRIRRLALNEDSILYPCYENFLVYDYTDGLNECWAKIPQADRYDGEERVGFGIIFRNLNFADVRLGLIYTLPDGTRRAYQMQDFFKDSTALAWFEDVREEGLWHLDVYYNLQPVFSQAFFIGDPS